MIVLLIGRDHFIAETTVYYMILQYYCSYNIVSSGTRGKRRILVEEHFPSQHQTNRLTLTKSVVQYFFSKRQSTVEEMTD